MPPWAASFMNDLSFALREEGAGLFEVVADDWSALFACLSAACAERPRPIMPITAVRNNNVSGFIWFSWLVKTPVVRHLDFAAAAAPGRGFSSPLLSPVGAFHPGGHVS